MFVQMIRAAFHLPAIFLAAAVALHASAAPASPHSLKLWYDRPATNWNEALPLGNGRLGARVFGGAPERLQLNEESLWAGLPVEAWPKDHSKHLQEVRRLLFRIQFPAPRDVAVRLNGEQKVVRSEAPGI